MSSAVAPITDIQRLLRHVRSGRVEDGRGSLGHSATLRFPSHRVTGGGRPPPVPTDRGVRVSPPLLFGSWFTAFTAICSSFVSMVRSYRQILVTAGPVRRRRLWADGRSAWR